MCHPDLNKIAEHNGIKRDFLLKRVYDAQGKFGLIRGVRNLYVLRTSYYHHKLKDNIDGMALSLKRFDNQVKFLEGN